MIANRTATKEFLARAIVALLFVLLSANLLADFIQTRHVTGLLLLVNEALVAILTVLHRPAFRVDRSAKASLVTVVSVAGPVLLRAGSAEPIVPDAITAMVALGGLAIVIAAKLTLGRSFGLVPANRGVVDRGPYLIVRHPIYAGYLINHGAFLLAHPDWTNIALIAIADSALIIRALLEERVLGSDTAYQTYCTRVGWHLVPGVF